MTLAARSTLGKMDRTRSAEAENYILQGLKQMDEMKAKSMCAAAHLILGEFYVDTGQTQKALETLEKTQQMMTQMGMTDYWLARTEKALERAKR